MARLTVFGMTKKIIAEDILCCDSGLVTMLFERGDVEGFSYEDIEYNRPDPDDMDAEECESWLRDKGFDLPERDDEDDDEWEETLRSEVEDRLTEADPEIYEWWRITDYLKRHLESIGEPILDNGYGTWWGRTCSGQAIHMDGTIQEIVRATWPDTPEPEDRWIEEVPDEE